VRSTLNRVFWLALLSLLTTGAFAQQDFSADMVNTSDKTAAGTGKIYASKDKMRFEGSQQNGHGGTVIMNFSTQTMDILMPERKMYIENPMGQGPGAQHTLNLFRVGDAENACDEWQKWRKMAGKSGGSCQKAGSDIVNGRSTVKYEGTSAEGDASTVWIDPKLRFPIKWQGKNSGGEMRNIQEGAQPASLFAVPSDYQKFDMGGMGMPRTTPPR
jgi:hypothetical protein